MSKQIYVISAVGSPLHKIGQSTNASHRLRTLQPCSPLELKILVAEQQTPSLNEATLHRIFADRRAHGEWFHVDAAEIELVFSQRARLQQLHDLRPRNIGEVDAETTTGGTVPL